MFLFCGVLLLCRKLVRKGNLVVAGLPCLSLKQTVNLLLASKDILLCHQVKQQIYCAGCVLCLSLIIIVVVHEHDMLQDCRRYICYRNMFYCSLPDDLYCIREHSEYAC